MKKKILIAIIVLVLLLVAAYFYLDHRGRTLSPPGNVSLTHNELTVSIAYSRPSVRNRVIFGSKEQNALQPYGEYWRLGANESTEITFTKNVLFNGKPVKAGTYRIYAIPGPTSFDIVLNSQLGTWGAFQPKKKLDVERTSIPVEKISPPVEQYTISMLGVEDGVQVNFEWDTVRLTLLIRPD